MVKLTYRLANSLRQKKVTNIFGDQVANPQAQTLAGALGMRAQDAGKTYGFNVFNRIYEIQKRDPKVTLDFVLTILNKDLDDKLDKAVQIIKDTADTVMSNFFIWTAQTFMTEGGKGVAGAALWNAGVVWKPLSSEYVEYKLAKNRSPDFWRFSGKLYRQFMSRNSKRRRMFGGTTVSLQGGGLRVKIASDLTYVFSEGGSTVMFGRGIEQELIERGFSGNEEMVRKLQGRLEYYRPLLGPALLYYMKKVVRVEIVKALRKKGFRIKGG